MYIVFDIGGTNIRLGKSINGSSLDQVVNFPTPIQFNDGVALIIKKITELVTDKQILGIAGGVSGTFDKDNSQFTHRNNLKDWSNKPLVEKLKKTFDCSVTIKNDAIMAGLGEAIFGTGRDYSSVMYITLGTGIGGAWILDKQVATNQYNFEPGHQILDITNQLDLEKLASGTFLANKFGKNLEQTPKAELWNSIRKTLIIGLYNTFMHWPSDIIILGGGVTLKIELPIDELKSDLHKLLSPREDLPEVAIAELGDNSGLYGALSLINK